MGANDWFRNATWSPSVRTAFFERLNRSRGAFHKAQYARIQALHLEEASTGEMYLAAIELLDLIQEKWWGEAGHATVYHQYARCHEGLGNIERAIKFYRRTFDAQREFPGVQTMAHMDFGWLVIRGNWEDLFDEASGLIDEFGLSIFPKTQYQGSAVKAVILDSKGQKQAAKKWAEAALEAAAATQSGLTYHQKLGLVESTDDGLYAKLKRIAAD